MTRHKLLSLYFLMSTAGIVLAQKDSSGVPTVAAAAVPLYPPLARSARLQGVVHVKVNTNGEQVIAAQALDGNRLLAVAAEENARTWKFAKHLPTSFTLTYRYKIDPEGNPNYPLVVLRFPAEIEVTTAPLVLSDPPAELRRGFRDSHQNE